jgi:hypothetical protein
MKAFKIFSALLTFLGFSIFCPAQQNLAKMIKKENFDRIQPLRIADITSRPKSVGDDKEMTFLNIDQQIVSSLVKDKPSLLSVEIKSVVKQEPFILLLKKVEVLKSDFICRKSSGEVYTIADIPPSVQYAGVIKGQENTSLVSLCFFNGEVTGVMSNQEDGNFIIGKLKDEPTHVLYRSEKIPGMEDGFACYTKNGPAKQDLNKRSRTYGEQEEAEKCVRVYVEVHENIYTYFSSDLTSTLNFTIGLFSTSFAIFLNEGANLYLSEIKVWDRSQGGPQCSSSDISGFGASLGGIFNGDIAHLICLGQSKLDLGGAAPENGAICRNKTNAICYSTVLPYYTPLTPYTSVPAYSGSVKLISHEMGHVLGSPHTHECVWNGVNGLDECGQYSGDPTYCFPGTTPANGGTIMSYCDNGSGPGVSFANGFALPSWTGDNPRERILSMIASSDCLENCCLPNWNSYRKQLSAPISYAVHHFATESIDAFNDVAHNSDEVIYRAGNTVTLSPGFRTNLSESAVFIAEISKCNQVVSNDDMRDPRQKMLQQTADLKLFPNPFQYEVMLESVQALYRIEIYDLNGRLENQVILTGQKFHKINLSTLATGMHYLKASFSNGTSSVIKLIKM